MPTNDNPQPTLTDEEWAALMQISRETHPYVDQIMVWNLIEKGLMNTLGLTPAGRAALAAHDAQGERVATEVTDDQIRSILDHLGVGQLEALNILNNGRRVNSQMFVNLRIIGLVTTGFPNRDEDALTPLGKRVLAASQPVTWERLSIPDKQALAALVKIGHTNDPSLIAADETWERLDGLGLVNWYPADDIASPTELGKRMVAASQPVTEGQGGDDDPADESVQMEIASAEMCKVSEAIVPILANAGWYYSSIAQWMPEYFTEKPMNYDGPFPTWQEACGALFIELGKDEDDLKARISTLEKQLAASLGREAGLRDALETCIPALELLQIFERQPGNSSQGLRDCIEHLKQSVVTIYAYDDAQEALKVAGEQITDHSKGEPS